MDKRTVSGLHNIKADYISGITYSGVQINNFEQYLLGVSRIVGISSANYDDSIALIENDINNLVITTNSLSVSGLATETNLANFKITCGTSGNVIGVSSQNLHTKVKNLGISYNSLDDEIGIINNDLDDFIIDTGVSFSNLDQDIYNVVHSIK